MGIVPPLGIGESLTARRLTASPLVDETDPLDSLTGGGGGGILVWRLSYYWFLGVLWVWAIPKLGALPQDSTPTTYYHTLQLRITLLDVIAYASRCKCEIVKWSFINKVWEEHVRYLA